MNLKRAVAFIVVMCLSGLTACSKAGTSAPEAKAPTTNVHIELGTPDKALKSYWAVRDSVRSKMKELQIQYKEHVREAENQMNAVAEGSLFLSGDTPLETFSRDIIDLKVESESRAVVIVVIKNITPIPAGGEVSKFVEEYRRDGQRYKYVLEKNQAGWRVSEIWSWSTYPSTDWKKEQPGDGKPYVPWLVYNGI